MVNLPDRIEKCPIKEAVFEVRFSSKHPVDAIFGMLYVHIKEFFADEPTALPILQLPESVRKQDQNLKYQAYYKLSKGSVILNVGPRVLTFINASPYDGWTQWSHFIYTILERVKESEVIDKIERIGLRYINLFENNIFDKVKFEAKIIDTVLTTESTNLRTEIVDGDFVKILQIGNAVHFINNNTSVKGSIIDIDCLYSDPLSLFDDYRDIIEKAHVKEKELFFSLLKDTFLQELNPEFGE